MSADVYREVDLEAVTIGYRLDWARITDCSPFINFQPHKFDPYEDGYAWCLRPEQARAIAAALIEAADTVEAK